MKNKYLIFISIIVLLFATCGNPFWPELEPEPNPGPTGPFAPSAPQNFSATPGDTQVSLVWTAPASDGGSVITGYQVSSDNGANWVTMDIIRIVPYLTPIRGGQLIP